MNPGIIGAARELLECIRADRAYIDACRSVADQGEGARVALDLIDRSGGDVVHALAMLDEIEARAQNLDDDAIRVMR